jgi:hypothetical protein
MLKSICFALLRKFCLPEAQLGLGVVTPSPERPSDGFFLLKRQTSIVYQELR